MPAAGRANVIAAQLGGNAGLVSTTLLVLLGIVVLGGGMAVLRHYINY